MLAQHAVYHHVCVLGDDVPLHHPGVALELAKVAPPPLLVGDPLVLLLLVLPLLGERGEALGALAALEGPRAEVGGEDVLLDLDRLAVGQGADGAGVDLLDPGELPVGHVGVLLGQALLGEATVARLAYKVVRLWEKVGGSHY